MRIGIVTFHRAHNCGAALQCVALQTVLEKLGHEAVVVDCNDVGDGLRDRLFVPTSWLRFKYLARVVLNRMKPARWRYVRFRRRFMRLSRPCPGRLQDVACDCYVLGSDQVLNPQLMENYRDVFLMARLNSGMRRVSYAASFGVPSLPEAERAEFRAALGRFEALGVREESGVDICKSELGLRNDVVLTLDPTLLLDATDYRRLESPVRTSGDYVLVYHIGWALETTLSIARRVAHRLNAQIVVTSLIMPHPSFEDVTWLFGSPDQFLSLVRNARCVVTTSFHGAAFSIVYRRPLISVLPKTLAVKGRVTSLLRRLGMEDCIVQEGSVPSDEGIDAALALDLDRIQRRLESLRNDSIGFLKKAVTA